MLNQVKHQEAQDERVNKRIAQWIGALLEESDELGTFRALGKATGIGYKTIHKWSNEMAEPRLQKLAKFSYALGWSLTEVMSFAEGEETPQEAIARKKKLAALASKKSPSRYQEVLNLSDGANQTNGSNGTSRKSQQKEDVCQDLLPSQQARERLRILLLNSMATRGIVSSSQIITETGINGSLLRVVLEVNTSFRFGLSALEELAPFLYKVEGWNQLHPLFETPQVSYKDCVDELIADLQKENS